MNPRSRYPPGIGNVGGGSMGQSSSYHGRGAQPPPPQSQQYVQRNMIGGQPDQQFQQQQQWPMRNEMGGDLENREAAVRSVQSDGVNSSSQDWKSHLKIPAPDTRYMTEELTEMDTEALLSHRRSKFREIGGFLENSYVEPEKKRNMKQKDVDVTEVTANLELELENMKKAVLEGKEKSPEPIFSDENVELVKQDVDKETANTFIAMGLQEKLETLKKDLLKTPSNQNPSPALKERVDKLTQEFKNNLINSNSFDGLTRKIKVLGDINTLQEHRTKGEKLKKEINDQLQNQAKEKMEILRKARDSVAKGEELDENTLKEVNNAKEDLLKLLKSANLEVVGVGGKISPSAPPALLEKARKANEVIFGEIEKAVGKAGLRGKLDELRSEIVKGQGKDTDKVTSLISELREGIGAQLNTNELENLLKSSTGLPSPGPVSAGLSLE